MHICIYVYVDVYVYVEVYVYVLYMYMYLSHTHIYIYTYMVWYVCSHSLVAFQDGTVAFLGIASLRHGFRALELVGGMAAIERHTSALASEMHRELLDLRHSNGSPAGEAQVGGLGRG